MVFSSSRKRSRERSDVYRWTLRQASTMSSRKTRSSRGTYRLTQDRVAKLRLDRALQNEIDSSLEERFEQFLYRHESIEGLRLEINVEVEVARGHRIASGM